MIRKMLLVDDHPLVLSALEGMVAAIDPGVAVVLAEGAGQARQRLREHADVELVLLDLTLADAEGVQALAGIREDHPLLPVVVLSATDHMPDVVAALDLGAMGFISKRTGHAELARALALVMAGGVYVPMAMQAQLAARQLAPSAPPAPPPATQAGVARLAEDEADPGNRSGAGAGASAGDLGQGGGGVPAAALPLAAQFAALGLTPRQSDVLGLLLRGLSNKLIARELCLSVETVKDHVAAVLRVLGVNSRTQAVLAVSRLPRPDAGASPTRAAPTEAALAGETRRDPA